MLKLSPAQVVDTRVGRKAMGLACLPPEWRPQFLVVDSNFAGQSVSDIDGALLPAIEDLKLGNSLIIRSSGPEEAMGDRGRLPSQRASPKDVASCLNSLKRAVEEQYPSAELVHWVVQAFHEPVRKGHLSNERHLCREPRDWIVAFEPGQRLSEYQVGLGLRNWRDGPIDSFEESALSCPGVTFVDKTLRTVAKWGATNELRLHFEWVWDGARVWVVQVDVADEVEGEDPHACWPEEVPEVDSDKLSLFKTASAQEDGAYSKLRNARLYEELGYEMPPFYLLDNDAAIKEILKGRVSNELTADLEQLTKRPFILRTDGLDIPPEKREMLPRSDGLCDAEQASAFLNRDFSNSIREGDLDTCELCIIGHHFIPSVASAWARAEPEKEMVRIESLWGLPEGLYWFSHDTYEVSCRPRRVGLQRQRFKGWFVAADRNNQWRPKRVRPPFDWRKSIEKRAWLTEIASTTKAIAEREGFPVSVMWFLGNDPRASRHEVLPWYHSRAEFSRAPRAAPRQKYSFSTEYEIGTSEDWEALKQAVGSGENVERVVIRPREAGLIRNLPFVEELAHFVSENGIVVELAGGILSHAYYALQRCGAQVECVDLVGANEDVIQLNKIVRDQIPEMIEDHGERVEVVRLTGEALLAGLRQKLVEESFETLDAKGTEEIVGELADVKEVVRAIIATLEVEEEQVEGEQLAKRRARGAFEDGLVLRQTATPHSIPVSPPNRDSELPLESGPDGFAVVSDPKGIPIAPSNRRPDLRQTGAGLEKILSFDIELNKLEGLTQDLRFSLPLADDHKREFLLRVELRRDGAALRTTVRLLLLPEQLTI